MSQSLISKVKQTFSKLSKLAILMSLPLTTSIALNAQTPIVSEIKTKAIIGHEKKEIKINGALFDYTLKHQVKTGDEIIFNEKDSIEYFAVNSNKKTFPKDFNVVFVHGFTVDALTTWVYNDFVTNLKIANQKPKDLIYIDYDSYAKRPHQISDDVYQDLQILLSKHQFDFKNSATLLVAHSNGTLVTSNLLQRHPDIISQMNVYAVVLLGPPLKGADEIARNLNFNPLTKIIKPMQDFTGNTLEMHNLVQNMVPCVPKLIVYGDVTQENTNGRYTLLHPILKGKDDGLVDAKATDITTQLGWLDATFGGLDLWTGINLDHTNLRNDLQVTDIINDYTTFLKLMHEKGFAFRSNFKDGKKIDDYTIEFNEIKFKLKGNSISCEYPTEFNPIRSKLNSDFDLNLKLNDLSKQNSIFFSTAKIQFKDFFLSNMFNIVPELRFEDQNGNKYLLFLNGNGKVTGYSTK